MCRRQGAPASAPATYVVVVLSWADWRPTSSAGHTLLLRRELAARQAAQAGGISRRLTSLDREGYAGPMGVLELGQAGSSGSASRGNLAQQQRDFMRATDRARLMAGMRNSSAYDAEED